MSVVLNGQASLLAQEFAAMGDEELRTQRQRYLRRIDAAHAVAKHFRDQGARRIIERYEATLAILDAELEAREF